MKLGTILGALIIFYFVLLSNAKKHISEIRCVEYSKVEENATIKDEANRATVQYYRSDISWFMQTGGTLISDQYILSAYQSDFKLEKAVVILKSDNSRHTITQHFIRYFFHLRGGHQYGVLLVKLSNPITLNSLHRPACLWLDESLQLSTAEVLRGMGNTSRVDNDKNKPIQILSSAECADNIGDQFVTSFFCLTSREPEYYHYNSLIGSPVHIRQAYKDVPSNYYVSGVVIFSLDETHPPVTYATKIYNHLEWIEEIVWGQKDICGRRQIDIQPFITNPNNTDRGEFPWHASIHENINRTRNYTCGATLLNKRVLLTAAHCVTNGENLKLPESLTVTMGNYNLDETSSLYAQMQTVSKIILPTSHKFNRAMIANDIAIIKVALPFDYSDYVQPICLTQNGDMFPDNNATLPGWGKNENDEFEIELKKGYFPIASDEECVGLTLSLFKNSNNFCAGSRSGTTACSGDSGGGLVTEFNNQWYLRGVVSISIPSENTLKCDPLQYAIFTNVYNFYVWIIEQM